jgi:MFS family permease
VTAGGFAVSSTLTLLISGLPPVRHQPGDDSEGIRRVWRQTREGVRFVWRDAALRSVAVLSCAIVAAYLPFESVIFPAYFTEQGQPERLGIIVTAMSAGGILGALAHARVVDLIGRRAVYVWGIFITCVLLGVVALFPPFWLMAALSVAVGALYGPINPISNLAIQVLTPEQLRGRVVGIVTSTAYAAGPLGLLVAGPLVEWRGVHAAAAVFALLVILAALAGFFLPGLRRLDNLDVRLPDPADSH